MTHSNDLKRMLSKFYLGTQLFKSEKFVWLSGLSQKIMTEMCIKSTFLSWIFGFFGTKNQTKQKSNYTLKIQFSAKLLVDAFVYTESSAVVWTIRHNWAVLFPISKMEPSPLAHVVFAQIIFPQIF